MWSRNISNTRSSKNTVFYCFCNSYSAVTMRKNQHLQRIEENKVKNQTEVDLKQPGEDEVENPEKMEEPSPKRRRITPVLME